MLHRAAHEPPEAYADQTIADDGGAGSRAKVLENGFVKCEADLVPAICDAWSAEVHPGSDGSTGAEDKPERSDRLHVWKKVNQGDQTHQTADGGAAKAQDPFLVAGADRRQRHHEARDDRRVDTRIIEPDEDHVANEGCHRALDRKANILEIFEGIRQK